MLKCGFSWSNFQSCQNRGGQGGQWTPIFVRSVNPIRNGEGRLSPTITTGTPKVFHLPASLILSVKLTGVLNIFSALHCYPIGYIKSLQRYIFFIHLPPVEVGHFCGKLESFSGAREITLNAISQKTLGLVRCQSKNHLPIRFSKV